ncbi:DUF2272 domain-containing protein [Methylolobus aquaticus]
MSKIKTIALCAGLSLSGCGGQKKPPPVLPSPVAEVPVSVPVKRPPPLSPTKRAIVNVAKAEWDYFGQQRVVYQGNEESIPHVGFWEDDDSHVFRVNMYWSAVGMPGLDGNDCKQPWSAAFISYVMQRAGVPSFQFPPARAHWVYLKQFVRDNGMPGQGFVPHGIREYRAQPGDLICATREHYGAPMLRGPADASFLDNNKLHCDIVVTREGSTLEVIGGNVRNSVSKSVLTLDGSGYLQPIKRRPWFVVVENRL